jgi:hypothetical protein
VGNKYEKRKKGNKKAEKAKKKELFVIVGKRN